MPGLVGLILLGISFTPWDILPEDYSDNVLLFAFSTFLIGSWLVEGRRQAERHEAQERAGRVDNLLGMVEGLAAGAPVRQVPGNEIKGILHHQLSTTRSWRFRGGSGRWERSVVLPKLAGVTDQDVLVELELLDPRRGDLCSRYARYRDSQRAPEDRRANEGDARTIQADILACICAAAWHQSRSRMDCTVTLISHYSPLRYDIGDESLLVTVASKFALGYFAKASTFFYQGILDEFASLRAECPRVSLPATINCTAATDFNAARARELLDACKVEQAGQNPQPLLVDFADPAGLDFDVIAKRTFDSNAI